MNKVFIALNFLLLFSCSSLKETKEEFKKISKGTFFDKQQRDKDHLNIIWTKNLDLPHKSGNLPITTASPLIHDNYLYIGSLDGKMRAFDAYNGTLKWESQDKLSINSAPIAYKDMLLYGSVTGRFYSRDLKTGKLNYEMDLGSSIEGRPVVDNSGRLFVVLRDHQVIALDSQTGKVFWSYKRSVPFRITLNRVSRPMLYKNSIILGFADGHIVRLSKDDGSILWDQALSNGPKFIDVDLSPVLYKDWILATSAYGKLSFVNPTTGFVSKSVNIKASSQPILTSSGIAVGDQYGEIYLLDSSGQIKKKEKISDHAISSIKKWSGSLAIATMGDDLIIVDPFTFKVISKRKLGSKLSSVFSPIFVSDDLMTYFSSRSRLYVHRHL